MSAQSLVNDFNCKPHCYLYGLIACSISPYAVNIVCDIKAKWHTRFEY